VGDLRRSISKAENIIPSRVTVIEKGRKLDRDEELLSKFLGANSIVIAIIGKDNNASESKSEPYVVEFDRKPFGIRIQSNRLQRDAFVIKYENDYGRNSGVRIGSKVTHIDGEKVDGLKTVDIEEKIMEADVPIKLTMLPREGMPQSELNNVEGLSEEDWLPKVRSENSMHLIHPSDYIVNVDRREMGISIFSGSGGRGAYIIAFLSDFGPKIGMRAGSMVVSINGVNCENWLCNDIISQLTKAELPVELILRGSEGLTSKQFPVLIEEKTEEQKLEKIKPGPISNSEIKDKDMFTVVFIQRPLGFGIMSPLGKGVMVSSVQDEALLKKGMIPGSPILTIGGVDVQNKTLAGVARLMSGAQLPMAIGFGKEMYFRPGDKVLVQFKDEWYRTTIQNFDPKTRKIAVLYDDKPFKFKNSEKIQDFTRIRKLEGLDDRDVNEIFSIHA